MVNLIFWLTHDQLMFRFTDDQFDPELAATIGVDFKVKVHKF